MNVREMFNYRELNDYSLNIKSLDIDTRNIPTHIIIDFSDLCTVELEELVAINIRASTVISVFARIAYEVNADVIILDEVLDKTNIPGIRDILTTQQLNAIEEYIEFLMEEYYAILHYHLMILKIADVEYLFLAWISEGVGLLEMHQEYVHEY